MIPFVDDCYFISRKDNKWISYRCTGWNDIKKIKFVIDKEEKQKRFAFDNKEFKAFFKDKKIEF